MDIVVAASPVECRPALSEVLRRAAASTAPSSNEALAVANEHPSAGPGAGKRSSKKRSRASRRPPTITLVADSDNFQAIVQQLTGFQSSPFLVSSSATNTDLQGAGNSSTGLEMLGNLKPHPSRPEAFPGGQSASNPGLSTIDGIKSVQSLNLTSHTFRELIQNKQVFPFPLPLKPYYNALDSNRYQRTYSFTDSHAISPPYFTKKSISPHNGIQSIDSSNVGDLFAPTIESSNVRLVDGLSDSFWDTDADHQILSVSLDDLYD